jgi:hypothetical protein
MKSLLCLLTLLIIAPAESVGQPGPTSSGATSLTLTILPHIVVSNGQAIIINGGADADLFHLIQLSPSLYIIVPE